MRERVGRQDGVMNVKSCNNSNDKADDEWEGGAEVVESVGIETDLVHIITKTVVTAFQLSLVENLIIAL